MLAQVVRFYVGTRPGKGRGLPDDYLLSQCDRLVPESVQALSRMMGATGVTVYGARGYWEKEHEETFVFEVLTSLSPVLSEMVQDAASSLAALWAQDAILVTTFKASAVEVYGNEEGENDACL